MSPLVSFGDFFLNNLDLHKSTIKELITFVITKKLTSIFCVTQPKNMRRAQQYPFSEKKKEYYSNFPYVVFCSDGFPSSCGLQAQWNIFKSVWTRQGMPWHGCSSCMNPQIFGISPFTPADFEALSTILPEDFRAQSSFLQNKMHPQIQILNACSAKVSFFHHCSDQ